uniref:Lipoxygenase n=1 Tax=Cucumis sativus TaxID=3659 RepID=A0A0A0LLR6_CUCSA
MVSKEERRKILGEVVLMKSNVLDFDDFSTSLLDTLYEFVGKRVSLQLVSAIHGDPSNELRGKLGEEAYLEEWITTITPLTTGEATFKVTFDWDEQRMGIPGAFFITNHHHSHFYLKSLTLQHVPPHGTTLFFPCNSWIYPSHRYKNDRIFFLNQFIKPEDKSAWRTDEEFGREMLAGLNPVVIRKLQDFPPRSKLDPEVYGDQKSKITEEQIIHNLDELTVEESFNMFKIIVLFRGMAIEDSNSPHGLRLVIEDYPYAVDGLEIWSAIKTWVTDYCSFYYKTDEAVRNDPELQSWWKELREEGHGDKKDEPWWPKMQNIEELIDTCAIIIWIASALHAAVNFGQYPYAGYLPNRPTISRKFMPEEGTPEYKELETNPEKAFLRTITAQLQTLLGIASIEILSRHSSDEVYLGQRDSPKWTADKEALDAFEKFGKKLAEIEDGITKRNEDLTLRNRVGPVFMPYTLLYPSSEEGLTGKGIPNSVSI